MKNNHRCLFFEKYREWSLNICSIIIIILLSLFIILCLVLKIDFSVSYSSIVVKEDDFLAYVLVKDSDIQYISKSFLVIDGVGVDYSIDRISEDYVLTENGPMKYVYLKFDMDEKYKIINNVIKLNFVHRETIFNKVKEMFL